MLSYASRLDSKHLKLFPFPIKFEILRVEPTGIAQNDNELEGDIGYRAPRLFREREYAAAFRLERGLRAGEDLLQIFFAADAIFDRV